MDSSWTVTSISLSVLTTLHIKSCKSHSLHYSHTLVLIWIRILHFPPTLSMNWFFVLIDFRNERFPRHLSNCRGAYKKKMRREGRSVTMHVCRYNYAHQLPGPELLAHERHCPHRSDVVTFVSWDKTPEGRRQGKPTDRLLILMMLVKYLNWITLVIDSLISFQLLHKAVVLVVLRLISTWIQLPGTRRTMLLRVTVRWLALLGPPMLGVAEDRPWINASSPVPMMRTRLTGTSEFNSLTWRMTTMTWMRNGTSDKHSQGFNFQIM